MGNSKNKDSEIRIKIMGLGAETKDPTSGSTYFYNKKTGITQWERPSENGNVIFSPVLPKLLEGWEEALDASTGQAYYYNKITNATQWDRPTLKPSVISTQFHAGNDIRSDNNESYMKMCLGYGGWGKGIVQSPILSVFHIKN
ncbi:hypothetical protein ZOSMA_1694G00010 [Zostera marina]|uniref:Polyglutamine-binding protein 1 n=1 Tax=Zostera marina TaxID=29655 RepID=A0A0K9PTI5_ZOSMR|nr:hypothetical protein ZOSMA_1694G00010 [Zostera marina]